MVDRVDCAKPTAEDIGLSGLSRPGGVTALEKVIIERAIIRAANAARQSGRRYPTVEEIDARRAEIIVENQ